MSRIRCAASQALALRGSGAADTLVAAPWKPGHLTLEFELQQMCLPFGCADTRARHQRVQPDRVVAQMSQQRQRCDCQRDKWRCK